MDHETDIFLDSLMKWMSTFPVSAGRNPAESLCDGVAMAQVWLQEMVLCLWVIFGPFNDGFDGPIH